MKLRVKKNKELKISIDTLKHGLFSLVHKIKEKIKSNEKLRGWAKKIRDHPKVIAAVKKFQSLDWSERVVILIAVSGLILFIVGPYSLLYRKTHLISYEAIKRGETLIRLLSASNQAAFSDREDMLYSVQSVDQELGVNDAMVTNLEGMILSPVERFGKSFEKMKNASTKNCSRLEKGLEIEFFCPIFRWVEKDQGFVKEPVGMAYIDYSANESLDLMGSRAFHVVYLLVLFGTTLFGLGYLIVTMTHKPLEDLKYDLLTYRRGGTHVIAKPNHFGALQALTEEITEALKNSGQTASPQNAELSDDTLFIEIIRQTALVSHRQALLIDADKKLIFATASLQEETKIKIGQHILRAVKDSPYVNELVEFFSKLFEGTSDGLLLNLPHMDELEGIVLKLKGKNYYLVLSV